MSVALSTAMRDTPLPAVHELMFHAVAVAVVPVSKKRNGHVVILHAVGEEPDRAKRLDDSASALVLSDITK